MPKKAKKVIKVAKVEKPKTNEVGEAYIDESSDSPRK